MCYLCCYNKRMPVSRKRQTKSQSSNAASRKESQAHQRTAQRSQAKKEPAFSIPPVSDFHQPSSSREIPLHSLPQKPVPVLVKTTYNTSQVRRAGLVLAVVLLVSISWIAWSLRDRLITTFHTLRPAKPVYHLSVSAEKLDTVKAGLVRQQVGATASAAATPTSSPTPGSDDPVTFVVPEANVLAGYTTNELLSLLNRQIQQLQSEQQDTRLLELLKKSGTRQDLLKAIQLGREYQALYLYYKK